MSLKHCTKCKLKSVPRRSDVLKRLDGLVADAMARGQETVSRSVMRDENDHLRQAYYAMGVIELRIRWIHDELAHGWCVACSEQSHKASQPEARYGVP